MALTALSITDAIKKLYGKDIGNGPHKKFKYLEDFKESLKQFKVYLKSHPIADRAIKSVLIIAALLIAWGIIACYNTYSRYRNYCQLYMSQVGVELKRRQNLIPNLVLCVSGYSVHEKGIMSHVADARQILSGPGSISSKIEAAKQMEGMLSKLLAIVEQYPNLKASETTQTLLKELSNTENRIADGKMKYNESAKDFNNVLSTFPTNIVGYLFGIRKPIPYLTTDEDLMAVALVNIDQLTAS
ncbi:MAG: LemA family protein [Elusimicrobia bacterium]|nr:LemA family protein [Candidatus Obscuribacterium magneticum]